MSGFYLFHTYGFCLLWGFSQPLLLYAQRFFSVLGIHAAFCFSIPKGFLSSGYPRCFLLLYAQKFSLFLVFILFLLLYTQKFSLFWVFILLFASLCPKVFSLLGIHTAFCFSMPKVFPCPGYISDFCIRYAQTSIFICV